MTTRSLRDIALDNCTTASQMLSVLCTVAFPKPALLLHPPDLLTTSASNQEQYWKGFFPLKTALLEHALSLSDDLQETYEAPSGPMAS